MTDEVKHERVRRQKTLLFEIVDENGEVMTIKPEQVRVLAFFDKVTDEIFDLAQEHQKSLRIKL
jgi:hypothetical protein